jgi:hypothetical protein
MPPHVHNLSNIAMITLGFIADPSGREFSIAKINRTWINIFVFSPFEAAFAFIAVTSDLFLTCADFRNALIFGAISTATTPAATVVFIKKPRARGEFVDYLYGVVAFDDPACVMRFSMTFAFGSHLFYPQYTYTDKCFRPAGFLLFRTLLESRRIVFLQRK